MIFPGTVDLARYVQTDMLALLFSTLCLVALVRIARGGWRGWPAVFTICGLLLVFTRPAFYMLLGGALGLAAGVWREDPARRRAALACAGAAVGITALYLGAALASGSPSFSYVVADAREIFFDTQPPDAARSFFSKLKGVLHFSADDPLGIWYAKMVVNLFCRELARGIVTIFPLVAFFGLSTLRRDRAFGVIAGTVLALLLVPFLDPISLDMDRVFEFPMLPILAVGLVGAAAWLQARLTDPNQGQVRKVIKKTSPGG
jgi:4-amino-4-deoxy-L-arabinose transferase-like glycosyltransferase